MSTDVNFNGETFTLPTAGERGWASALTAFLVEVAENAITAAFTITSELDLGATYGIRAMWFRSKTSNPSTTGVVRLARTDKISWRNQANGADLPFGPGADNFPEWNGVDLVDTGSTQALSNKTLGTTCTITPQALTAFGAATANWTKSAGNDAPRYWKDALGMVHIQGQLLATGAASAYPFAAGSLPTGYRPLSGRAGVGYYNDDSEGTETTAYFQANADGSIQVFNPNGAAPGTGDSIIFYITFLAEA